MEIEGKGTENISYSKYTKRLQTTKEEKYLSNRIFKNISENMHYEIFKYLNSNELLEIRETTLGGYQLTSNKLLRSRINNYFTITNIYFRGNIKEKKYLDINLEEDVHRIHIIFEQTGRDKLRLEGMRLKDEGFI